MLRLPGEHRQNGFQNLVGPNLELGIDPDLRPMAVKFTVSRDDLARAEKIGRTGGVKS